MQVLPQIKLKISIQIILHSNKHLEIEYSTKFQVERNALYVEEVVHVQPTSVINFDD